MKASIRRFRAWTRTNRVRIERPFNRCFERFLPPRKERTAFYIAGVTIATLMLGVILGTVMTEIRVAHQQNQAVEIVVDDRA